MKVLQNFLELEASGGILLLLATLLALLAVNTPAQPLYDGLLATPVAVKVGGFEIAKPLLLWINDGLMAVFFFLVGLEIKREVLVGALSRRSQVALPLIAAVGGMAAPALIYVAINHGDPVALEGWAIPSATDIAFALGILSLLGNRVPASLKIFLLALAIADDLGAVLIIALFYTGGLSMVSLLVAGVAMVVLYSLNRRGVLNIAPYILVGLVLWAAVLKSGVHATIAGVVLAMFIPLRVPEGQGTSPVEQLESDLHTTVSFGILPLFAFANTGIALHELSLSSLVAPVPLGIAAGLFIGKQVGIFGLSWLAVKFRLANLPAGANWGQLYGVSLLCGVGFTMSLFISSLAFESVGAARVADDRLGILIGSALSGLVGYGVLRWLGRDRPPEDLGQI
ncbi:MAG: Na+/H+ antiporter NhaA [Gammaproteobacteria bacterium]|jgi:NhaA family Na+:H+ antiporter